MCLLPFYLPTWPETAPNHCSALVKLVPIPQSFAGRAAVRLCGLCQISDNLRHDKQKFPQRWETMLGGVHINAHHCRPPAYSQGRICEGRLAPPHTLALALGGIICRFFQSVEFGSKTHLDSCFQSRTIHHNCSIKTQFFSLSFKSHILDSNGVWYS